MFVTPTLLQLFGLRLKFAAKVLLFLYSCKVLVGPFYISYFSKHNQSGSSSRSVSIFSGYFLRKSVKNLREDVEGFRRLPGIDMLGEIGAKSAQRLLAFGTGGESSVDLLMLYGEFRV